MKRINHFPDPSKGYALVAFDKLRDSMSAETACEIARRTLAQMHAEWSIESVPLSNGDEGFVPILTHAMGESWSLSRCVMRSDGRPGRATAA